MVPSWNVGHSTFSKPDAHMMPLAGEGQQNGTVPRSWLFFVLRHFIWQELMRRAPPIGARHVMVTKMAIAFFPTSTKEMSEDDTPHDESESLLG